MQKGMQQRMKDEVVRKLQIRYLKYYKHWKDYDLLTCILTMIGLVLAVVDVITSFIS